MVATDDVWVSAPGPIAISDLYNGESFDARLHDPAWSTPTFDASAWAPVVLREFDTAMLVAPDGPPVRCVERLTVAEVITSHSGATILDFGQNLVGRLRIRARGEVVSAEEVKGGVQVVVRVTIECEGSDRPACVADTVSRFFP